jgi:hypothetical protein
VVPFAASRTMLIAVHAYSGRDGFTSLNRGRGAIAGEGPSAASGMRSPSRPWALSGYSPSRQDNGRSERRPASHFAACSVAFTVWFVVLASGRRGRNAAAARSLLEVWLVIERPKPTGLASGAIASPSCVVQHVERNMSSAFAVDRTRSKSCHFCRAAT